MKRCLKCGTEKPLSEYHRHKQTADGRVSSCKECVKAYGAAYRAERIEILRASQRQRSRSTERKMQSRIKSVAYRRSAKGKEAQKTYRAKYPEKHAARVAVSKAIRQGVLARKPCEVCGKKGEAHHEDYSRPLDVRWLCREHHAQEHRQYTD